MTSFNVKKIEHTIYVSSVNFKVLLKLLKLFRTRYHYFLSVIKYHPRLLHRIWQYNFFLSWLAIIFSHWSWWYWLMWIQGFGREKDENRADLCLCSIAFSFESNRLWCSILVIKVAVRCQVSRRLPEGEDDSGINGCVFKN